MEKIMLREETNWLSVTMDFIASTVIVYYGSMLFLNAEVTLFGAVLTGAILTIAEIFQHNWLLRSGRIQKETVTE